MTKEKEQQQGLRDFQNPSVWPFWPYPTIKRRNPDGGMPDCALLVDLASVGEPFDVHFLDADMSPRKTTNPTWKVLVPCRS